MPSTSLLPLTRIDSAAGAVVGLLDGAAVVVGAAVEGDGDEVIEDAGALDDGAADVVHRFFAEHVAR